MDLMKKRWLILIASCFVTLCVGSLYAWSVFASPMSAYLSELSGKEIASLAIVFTVANSVGPITMIGGGFVNDRIGPRSFYLMLMTLTCGAFAGMMIISQASPIAQQMMGFSPEKAASVSSPEHFLS